MDSRDDAVLKCGDSRVIQAIHVDSRIGENYSLDIQGLIFILLAFRICALDSFFYQHEF